jgi:signal transduction histidine kinase
MDNYKSDNVEAKADSVGREGKGTSGHASENRSVGNISLDELKAENETLRARVDELKESDRLKTAFLNNISSEIQTPLNTITGFCAFLTDPSLHYDKRVAYAKIISESSDQLFLIIADIANIAAIRSGQEQVQDNEVDLNQLFKQLFKKYSARAREQGNIFKYKTGFPDDEAVVLTDKTKLLRILSNLLINAIKFTGQGKVRFGYVLKDGDIMFYVEDTGIGIPSELQKDIFRRFEGDKVSDNNFYCESSLGLSISKAYVEMMGGRIWLESEAGRGSKFYFTIPLKRP